MINIKIDYLTNSIRNVVSGDTFETKVSLVSINDKKFIKKSSWIFNWHNEIKRTDRKIFKLTIKGNHKVLQGLISLSIQSDHIYVHLIESAKFNKGKNKLYEGVAGNLFAFACRLSFDKGFLGFIAFDAKSSLIDHYRTTLSATHYRGTKMFIDSQSALTLVKKYF